MSGDGERLNFDDIPDVPTKLVHRAVRTSDLTSDARHIMHVLALIADYKTSELPPKFTPSTPQLALETGLSQSTVTRRRKELEAAGWIVCKHPTAAERARHVSIRYKLAIPAVGAHQVYAAAAEQLAAELTDAASIQPDARRGFTVHPPEVSVWTPAEVSDSYLGDPSDSHLDDGRPVNLTTREVSDSYLASSQADHSSKSTSLSFHDLQKPPAAAGGREERFAAAEDLFEGFVREHGTKYAQRHPAIRAVIITAVADNGVPRNDAAKALHRLALAGKQITPDSLTTALARLREPDPARTAEPPPPPKPPRRLCPIHPAVELTEHGMCTSCAGDAKAGRDDFDEPAAPIPQPRHAPHAEDTRLITNRENAWT